jgi:hypothetical protein
LQTNPPARDRIAVLDGPVTLDGAASRKLGQPTPKTAVSFWPGLDYPSSRKAPPASLPEARTGVVAR